MDSSFSELISGSIVRIKYTCFVDMENMRYTLYNVCSVHRGDTMNTLGDVQDVGGIS